MTVDGIGNVCWRSIRSLFKMTCSQIIVVTWIVLTVPVFCQSPLSNEAILRQKLLKPVLEEIIHQIPDSGKVVFYTADKSVLGEWLVRNLSDSCLSRKYLVYSPPPQGVGNSYRVELSEANSDLLYRALGRKFGIGSGGWERRMNMSVHLAIRQPDGQLLVSRKISGAWQDRIQNKDISQIENPNLPFTVGTKSDSRLIKRWLEPVLTAGATVTMVYLFFSLRSDR